jgi:nitrate reductase NapAB chaperone NapD
MPDAIARVRDLARRLPGAEVHDTAHAAKLAIVLESAEDRLIGDAVAQLQELSGVIGVSIVSHIAEQTATLDEEHPDE